MISPLGCIVYIYIWVFQTNNIQVDDFLNGKIIVARNFFPTNKKHIDQRS